MAVGGDRYVEFLGQYNRNRLRVTSVQVPDVIGELREQVFTSGDRYSIENLRPKDRATLRSRYVQGKFDVALSGNYYGMQTFQLREAGAVPLACNPEPPQEPVPGLRCFDNGLTFLDNGPHLVLNADIGFDINDRLRLQAGAENLTNRRPPVRPTPEFDFQGIFPFYSTSGVPMNGQYLWTRVSVKF